MSYENFKCLVFEYVEKAGDALSVVFENDMETGRHYARFEDGTVIIGNELCSRVSVEWGSGHRAFANA